MKDTKLDIMLHPVRLRIMQTFLGNKKLTVQQISELLPDVPQATMYRHLNKLLKAGILFVVEENQIRGTVEKVYSLLDNGEQITKDDITNISKDDHLKYLFTFMLNILEDYKEYLNQETYDLVRDGVTYRQASVYLSDAEFVELMKVINTTVLKAVENKPCKERKLRKIATIVIPEKKEK